MGELDEWMRMASPQKLRTWSGLKARREEGWTRRVIEGGLEVRGTKLH